MTMNIPQRGNILFLILLAIILFAALSYVVTSSTRVSDQKGMSKEAANAAAGTITGWFSTLDAAIIRMSTTGGVDPLKIDFRDAANKNANLSGGYSYNGDLCSDASCELYATGGGGAIPLEFTKYVNPEYVAPSRAGPGYRDYMVMKIEGIGTSLNDVVLRIKGLKPEICSAYNRSVGISDASVTDKMAASGGGINYDGDTTAALTSSGYYYGTGQSAALAGQHTFCIITTGPPSFSEFYHVLIAR